MVEDIKVNTSDKCHLINFTVLLIKIPGLQLEIINQALMVGTVWLYRTISRERQNFLAYMHIKMGKNRNNRRCRKSEVLQPNIPVLLIKTTVLKLCLKEVRVMNLTLRTNKTRKRMIKKMSRSAEKMVLRKKIWPKLWLQKSIMKIIMAL